MNKEEILQKSRQENKESDLFEKDVLIKAGNLGAITAAIVCLIFFTAQILVGEGIDYGLWAVIFSIESAVFTYKAVKLKRRHEIVIAVMYILVTLMLSIAHITNLIQNAVIL